MAVSVVTRMGASLLVFLLMARGLGPELYGLVVTVIAYATLVSLLTDFGFASKILRDIAADRSNGAHILNAALNVKLVFTGLAAVAGGAAILLIPADAGMRVVIALVGAAVLIAAVGDLSLAAFRAMGRFVAESWLTLWTSTVHVLVVGWIALAQGDVLLLAVAFLVSRSAYAGLALRGAFGLFEGMRFTFLPWPGVLRSVRDAWSWAADSGLNYLNSQLDGLLIAPIFGLHAAGIYQAGARFVQAALGMVAILANVHIPRLARLGSASRLVMVRMLAEFACVGVFLALVFAICGPLITDVLLGPPFKEVDQLWIGFGVFVFLRYVAAAAGAQLAALGMPKNRVLGQIVGLVVMLVGFGVLLLRADYIAAPWVMSASALTICVAYWLALWRASSGLSSASSSIHSGSANE